MCIYANMIRAQINKTLFTIMVTHTHKESRKLNRLKFHKEYKN